MLAKYLRSAILGLLLLLSGCQADSSSAVKGEEGSLIEGRQWLLESVQDSSGKILAQPKAGHEFGFRVFQGGYTQGKAPCKTGFKGNGIITGNFISFRHMEMYYDPCPETAGDLLTPQSFMDYISGARTFEKVSDTEFKLNTSNLDGYLLFKFEKMIEQRGKDNTPFKPSPTRG